MGVYGEIAGKCRIFNICIGLPLNLFPIFNSKDLDMVMLGLSVPHLSPTYN